MLSLIIRVKGPVRNVDDGVWYLHTRLSDKPNHFSEWYVDGEVELFVEDLRGFCVAGAIDG